MRSDGDAMRRYGQEARQYGPKSAYVVLVIIKWFFFFFKEKRQPLYTVNTAWALLALIAGGQVLSKMK
jgi:hypothetical protein